MINILSDIVVILALASVVLVLSHRIHVPPILGFIFTGVLIGPHGLELVGSPDHVEMMAEIGVVLLLFSIGLDVSFRTLWEMRRLAFGGGLIQVVLTALGGCLLFSLMHADLRTSIFMGFFVALSSTAMVLKLLHERGETMSPHGRTALGILLFQDLAVVPIMLLIPALAGALGGFTASVGGQLLKSLGVLILVLGAGWVVPWLLYQVVRTGNREVFALSVIVICLAVARLTDAAGLSLALGAFLAGVIISESEYSHDALAIVLPFRHVFASIFFISIGMLVDLEFALAEWRLVLPLFLGVTLLKALAVLAAVLFLRYPLRTAVLSAMALAQVGEFSFVLLQSAAGYGLVTEELYQLLLTVALLSLSFTPFLLASGPRVASLLGRILPGEQTTGLNDAPGSGAAARYEDHLIIAGYGFGGRNVARAVKSCGIPYVILELNPERVRSARKDGEPIRYGDAVNEPGVRAVGIEKARVMVVAISDPAASRSAITLAKKLNPAIHLIVRTRYIRELPALVALGADQVIPEEFETSIEVFTRVLAAYLVPRADIESVASEIRSEGYQMLRKPEGAAFTVRGTELTLPGIEVSSFRVEPGSAMENRTLAEVDLRQRYRVTVLALRRGDEITGNPSGAETMRAGDMMVVMGTVSALADVGAMFVPPED